MSSGAEMSPIAVEMNGNVSGGELTNSKSSMESYTEDSASEPGSQPTSARPISTSTPIDRSREGSEQPLSSSTSGDGFVSSSSSSAPKFGTLIPNRIFVGGISCQTTEDELMQLFSKFGAVRGTKIILDRAGVSKGYGFVTFETEEEAKRLCNSAVEPIIHRDRRLNIAPAVKKQPVGRQDIPFSTPVDALSPPPPYDGTSVYFPQTAQATQFYAQPTPLPEPFFAQTAAAFCPGPLPSTSLPSFYSTTSAGPTPSGPVCYMPQQFQQFPQIGPCHNHWPTPPQAGGLNGNGNVNGQCQWRWVSPGDVTPTSPSLPPPSSFPTFMHHSCQNSNGQTMHQPTSFPHFLNTSPAAAAAAASSFPTPEQVFFLNSCVVPQPH